MPHVAVKIVAPRLRVVVPWLERDADAYSYVDLSAYEAGALLRAIHDSDRMGFRNGMISFSDFLKPDDVEAIRAYVIEQAHREQKRLSQ